MARGDIVLYKSSGRWYERAIEMATHGPYVHVAIQTSEKQVIAAGTKGVNYFPYVYDPKAHTVLSLVPRYTTPAGVEHGMHWALQQAGKRYGWLDILYQGVKFLAPNNPLQLTCDDSWDCSDFASRYLQQSGIVFSPEFSDPYKNTPNDLARWAGLLPPRKASA